MSTNVCRLQITVTGENQSVRHLTLEDLTILTECVLKFLTKNEIKCHAQKVREIYGVFDIF